MLFSKKIKVFLSAHADRMGFFIEENHETKETTEKVHKLRVEQLQEVREDVLRTSGLPEAKK